MEFCHVPMFDYIIIWNFAVDLLSVRTKLPPAVSSEWLSPRGYHPTVSLQYRQRNPWWQLTDSRNFPGRQWPNFHAVSLSRTLSCFAPLPPSVASYSWWALNYGGRKTSRAISCWWCADSGQAQPWGVGFGIPSDQFFFFFLSWWKTSWLLVLPFSLGSPWLNLNSIGNKQIKDVYPTPSSHPFLHFFPLYFFERGKEKHA